MDFVNTDALVTTEWVADHLEDPKVKFIDATFHLPGSDRDSYEEYTFRHLPGSHHLDVDKVCAPGTDLPHMLPSPEDFAAAVSKMGISNDDHVIVYDCNGTFMAACRVWWMFRIFGHDKVSVMDGGLLRWGRERRATTPGEMIEENGSFTATFRPELVKDYDQMMANLDSHEFQMVDARSPGRFGGIDHEPRPTEKRGHIPGSVNLPFPKLLDNGNDWVMRDADTVKQALINAGIDLDKPVIATCGSGVTAAVVSFAMYLIGYKDVPVYDGSWAEWGDHPDTPVGTLPSVE